MYIWIKNIMSSCIASRFSHRSMLLLLLFVAADIDDGFFRVVVICNSFILLRIRYFGKNRDRVNFALLANYRFIHSFVLYIPYLLRSVWWLNRCLFCNFSRFSDTFISRITNVSCHFATIFFLLNNVVEFY